VAPEPLNPQATAAHTAVEAGAVGKALIDADPVEQARGVLFLATEATYAVGTALLLDGGFTAG
jgi:NAD(P)-dependent dehydrogenase (short-subunit alcohol dehydrogenase family)